MDDLAAQLGVHPKTARRWLELAMALDQNLHVTKPGRGILFTEEQLAATLKALRRNLPRERTPQSRRSISAKLWPDVPDDYVFAHPPELRPEHTITLSARDHFVCGIYFLIRGSRVVYIGISRNVFARVEEHRRANRNFDRWHYEVCGYERAVALEAAYNLKLRPPMNRRGVPID